ncbi:nitroreductase family protein [Alkalibacter mobilis]|uniref:nitroreductase family protein n=1 Tax=Alkalibacter mobilis TaxID=2787712 RepID=UPI00189CF377|nr:nitroreductase family protein [Alkalibacter mobilis]MBF7097357.1 nitroreductase family protein [Alkalibacter mobilis]
MDLLTLAKQRYSSRVYSEEKINGDVLTYILEAGRVAPTAKNIQPYKVLVIQDDENLEKLSESARIYGAPLALVVCKDTDNSWLRPIDGKEHGDIDATIVTDHMMLAATDKGLNSVWICFFDSEKIKESFNFPPNLEPVNILVVGHSPDEPKSPDRHKETRKSLEDTIVFESF